MRREVRRRRQDDAPAAFGRCHHQSARILPSEWPQRQCAPGHTCRRPEGQLAIVGRGPPPKAASPTPTSYRVEALDLQHFGRAELLLAAVAHIPCLPSSRRVSAYHICVQQQPGAHCSRASFAAALGAHVACTVAVAQRPSAFCSGCVYGARAIHCRWWAAVQAESSHRESRAAAETDSPAPTACRVEATRSWLPPPTGTAPSGLK